MYFMYIFKVNKRNPNLEATKNNKNNNTDTKHKTVIKFWKCEIAIKNICRKSLLLLPLSRKKLNFILEN